MVSPLVVLLVAAGGISACGGGGGPPAPIVPAIVAPSIVTQPAAITVTVGQPAAFVVSAAGTAPLTYQWQRAGADIVGATAATYSLATTALPDNAASFRVVVRNPAVLGQLRTDPGFDFQTGPDPRLGGPVYMAMIDATHIVMAMRSFNHAVYIGTVP